MGASLAGKTVLITGSTQGLGLAAARRFAAAGCNVVLNGLANPEEVAGVITELESHRIKAMFSGADLSRPPEIEAMFETISDSLGPVDILINNAVIRRTNPVENFTVRDWDESLAVNLSSAFHTIRLALPAMRKRDWGRIINIGSVYSTSAAADRVGYVTTKTALVGLTRAVALETANQNITVNCVCPGTAETPVHAARLDAMATSEGISRETAVKRFLATKQPTGRFIDAEAVAGFLLFLCGPDARDITGAVLPIDGGWTAG